MEGWLPILYCFHYGPARGCQHSIMYCSRYGPAPGCQKSSIDLPWTKWGAHPQCHVPILGRPTSLYRQVNFEDYWTEKKHRVYTCVRKIMSSSLCTFILKSCSIIVVCNFSVQLRPSIFIVAFLLHPTFQLHLCQFSFTTPPHNLQQVFASLFFYYIQHQLLLSQVYSPILNAT